MPEVRPLRSDDADSFADWGIDEEFRSAAGWADRSRAELLEFHQRLIERSREDPRRFAAVADGELVGYVDFTPDRDGSCELGIVIGPRQRWSQHHGRHVLSAAVDYAKDHFAASRIWARTHATNAAARRMLTAAGFLETGPCGTDEYRGRTVTVIGYELPAIGQRES